MLHPNKKKYCPKCGMQVMENISYCPNCGYHFINNIKERCSENNQNDSDPFNLPSQDFLHILSVYAKRWIDIASKERLPDNILLLNVLKKYLNKTFENQGDPQHNMMHVNVLALALTMATGNDKFFDSIFRLQPGENIIIKGMINDNDVLRTINKLILQGFVKNNDEYFIVNTNEDCIEKLSNKRDITFVIANLINLVTNSTSNDNTSGDDSNSHKDINSDYISITNVDSRYIAAINLNYGDIRNIFLSSLDNYLEYYDTKVNRKIYYAFQCYLLNKPIVTSVNVANPKGLYMPGKIINGKDTTKFIVHQFKRSSENMKSARIFGLDFGGCINHTYAILFLYDVLKTKTRNKKVLNKIKQLFNELADTTTELKRLNG